MFDTQGMLCLQQGDNLIHQVGEKFAMLYVLMFF